MSRLPCRRRSEADVRLFLRELGRFGAGGGDEQLFNLFVHQLQFLRRRNRRMKNALL